MFQNHRIEWTKTSLFAGLFSLLLLPVSPARTEETDDAADAQVPKLYIGNLDTSEKKRFPNIGQFPKQGSVTCSLDGKLVAFDIWKPASSPTTSQVVVLKPDGTEPRVFEDAAMPGFSPNGRRIVVSRPTARGVWVIDLDGSTPPKMTVIDQSGWGADWSPDGQIVYAFYTRGGANLKVMDVVEGSRALFHEDESPYRQIVWNMGWSRDSKYIAFKGINKEGRTEIGVVDARGQDFGLKRRLEEDLSHTFCWSPDGTRLMFSKRDPKTKFYQIYSIDPDLKEDPKHLDGQDPEANYSDIAYTPDGKQLLFSTSKIKPGTGSN